MKLPCDDQKEAQFCSSIRTQWKRFVAVGEDDIIGRDLRVDDLKKKLCGKMKDLEGMNSSVGSRVKRDMKMHIVSISQKFYIKKIVKKFGMWDCVRLAVQNLQKNHSENLLVHCNTWQLCRDQTFLWQ
jgi:hypothetical protein